MSTITLPLGVIGSVHSLACAKVRGHPGALREMKQKGELWRFARHRRERWLNNRIEQDHRRIKRLTRLMLGFQGFWTAKRTLAGIEAMAMLAKGQVGTVNLSQAGPCS